MKENSSPFYRLLDFNITVEGKVQFMNRSTVEDSVCGEENHSHLSKAN